MGTSKPTQHELINRGGGSQTYGHLKKSNNRLGKRRKKTSSIEKGGGKRLKGKEKRFINPIKGGVIPEMTDKGENRHELFSKD